MKSKERINYAGKKVSIGIDVHKRQYTVTVVVEMSKVDVTTMVADPEALITYIKRRYEGAVIQSAYEAGFSGFVLHRKLEAAGIKSIVVNAASIEVSKNDRVKTDRRDSLKIATQLDSGSLKKIRIPSEEEELSRVLQRTREQHSKHLTKYRNQIIMKLYQFGYSLGEKFSAKRVKAFLEEQKTLPEILKQALESLLALYGATLQELKKFRKLLSEQAAKQPEIEARYRSIPGVGPIAARVLATELSDLQQFSNERKLSSFTGLTPSEDTSDQRSRKGHITRQGSARLRKVLVQSAWVAVRVDPWTAAKFASLAARLGKRRAIVAIARKLICKARALFRKKEWYCSTLSKA